MARTNRVDVGLWILWALTVVLVVCGWTYRLMAQVPPVINPNGVAFTSVDHAATENGTALITRYVLEILPVGGSTIAATRDLGKPTLTGNEVVFMQLAAMRTTLPAGSYVARVAAEGPGGRIVSPNSDPFSVAPRTPAAPAKPVLRQ